MCAATSSSSTFSGPLLESFHEVLQGDKFLSTYRKVDEKENKSIERERCALESERKKSINSASGYHSKMERGP